MAWQPRVCGDMGHSPPRRWLKAVSPRALGRGGGSIGKLWDASGPTPFSSCLPLRLPQSSGA